MQNRNIDIDQVFLNFPSHAYWKFFIDQRFWDQNDPYLFNKDESPLYFERMTLAFYINFLTINEPLNLNLIIGLHDLASHSQKYKDGGIREVGSSGLGPEVFTRDGLIELFDKIRNQQGVFRFQYQLNNDPVSYDVALDLSPTKTSAELADEFFQIINDKKNAEFYLDRKSSLRDACQTLSDYIDSYHRDIQRAQTDREKLNAIVTFVHQSHQFHPFDDANGRLFIFLLLDRLLIQNGLSPSIVRVPSRFTGYAIPELVREVELGQEDFKNLCQNNVNNLSMMTLLQRVLEKIYNKLISELELPSFVIINIHKLYENEEGRKLLQDLPFIYAKLVKIHDQATIDFVLQAIPPPSDPQQLADIAKNCNSFRNWFLLKKIIDMATPETIALMNEEGLIEDALGMMDALNLPLFCEHPKINMNSASICDQLARPYSANRDWDAHYLFRNLLLNNHRNEIIYFFGKLNDNDFLKLLSTDMYSINGLQLLALYDKELFASATAKIGERETNSLLSRKISCITTPESNDVNNPEFQRLVKEASVKRPAGALEELSLFTSPSGSSEEPKKKQSTFSKKV